MVSATRIARSSTSARSRRRRRACPAAKSGLAISRARRIRRDLETIVGFSKQSRAAGDRVWGRVTGFPAAAATHAWVAEQFRAAGLQNVQVQPYEASAPMWWATSWEVRVVASPAYGPGSRDVVLESAVPTSGSQIDGGSITAPLVTSAR